MGPETVVIIALLLFVGMALFGAPIAFSLLSSGTIGILLLQGTGTTDFLLATEPYSQAASIFLILIPLYIVMGMFVANGGLAEELYRVANHLLRKVPGGVGLATIAACAGFAAVTGSSIATVATMGRVSIDEMRSHGYSASFAAGIVGAAGTLGALIPPSVVLVIYGILAGESIGRMLIAGVVPGILVAVLYSAYVMVRSRSDVAREAAARSQAPVGASGSRVSEVRHDGSSSSATRPSTPPAAQCVGHATGGRIPYESLLYLAVIFFAVVGGIYSGLFTVIEGGAIAAIFAAVVIIVRTISRRGGVGRLIKVSVGETVNLVSMVFMLLLGGAVFAHLLVAARVPTTVANWAAGIEVSPYVILIVILLILIPLGMMLEPLSIMLITVPIFHPVVTELGFSGIWFGILFVRMLEVAMITPPVGLNIYVLSGAAKGITAEDGFKGSLPFVIIDLVSIGLFILFPVLILGLPEMV